MSNTVAATLAGIPQWAAQGLRFAASRGAPDRAAEPELLELAPLYGGARVLQPVDAIVAVRGARQGGAG